MMSPTFSTGTHCPDGKADCLLVPCKSGCKLKQCEDCEHFRSLEALQMELTKKNMASYDKLKEFRTLLAAASEPLSLPCDDYHRYRAEFIDSFERANAPIAVVVENDEDDANEDELGGEGHQQDRSTESVVASIGGDEDEVLPSCLIDEMPSGLIDIYTGKIHHF